MKKANTIITIAGVFIYLFSSGNMPDNNYQTGGSNKDTTAQTSVQQETKSTQTTTKSTQTKTKSTTTATKPVQTKTKSTQTGSKTTQTKTQSTKTGTKAVQSKTKPAPAGSKTTSTKAKPAPTGSKPAPVKKPIEAGTIRIGTQTWASVNLNVRTFRNGDSIPEARTNQEWVAAGEAGKPAWCYYNNDPANGKKYGKLYNWYAINDPRGLAPAGWTLPTDADWAKLAFYLGGLETAGEKMKSTSAWIGGNNGTNEAGFDGLPGGYRVENGTFLNLGSIGTWWSLTESRSVNGIDYYLVLGRSLGRSITPKQRGESVRCIRN